MDNTYDQIITDEARILQILLEQCILEESIELRINNQGQTFSTLITDRLQIAIPKPFDSFSYLKEKQSLLLEPLIPADGNKQIAHSDCLLIRFFNGYHVLEADIAFERFIKVHDKSVLQVGFPRQFGVVHIRKHFRVKAMPDSKIKVIINISNSLSSRTPIIDISTGGLSFCARHSPDLLSIGKKIDLTMSVLGEDDLNVDACIRHYTLTPRCNACADKAVCDANIGPQKAICGIEFSLLDHSQNKRLNELTALIHREHLIKEKKNLLSFNQELEKQVEEKTEQLRQKDLQLLEMDRVVGIATLAAGIAHEINNPLSFIKGSIGFIKKGVDKMVGMARYLDGIPVPKPFLKDYKDYLDQINFDYLINSLEKKFDIIKKGVERITKIVNSLSCFSRVDREEIGKIDINQSIEEAIKILASQGLEYVEFVKELQEVALIECSPSAINQCLFLTIQNAIDAVENNGIIKIITSYNEKEGQVLVKIVDNGKGMSPEVLRQAFNPFFTTKPVGSGTGMGLSIIERVTKRHGGKIDLSSKEGVGTTVTMTLPVVSKAVTKLKIED